MLFIFSSCPSVAQNGSEIDLLVNDLLKVADDFAAPAAKGAAHQAGAGWFTSAKELDLWQADVSVHGNVLFVPEGERRITVSGGDYAVLDIKGAETAEIPTAFGAQTDVVFEGEIFGQEFNFDAIDGLDKQLLAHPFVQAAVGLPMGSELIVRGLPEVTIDDVAISTYGVGFKHNFNQYFFNSQPNDFQFAALIAYSKYDVNYNFTPVSIENVVMLEEVNVDAGLWMLQFLSSKSFYGSNWEVFGAVDVTNSDFVYALGGSGIALRTINSKLQELDNNELIFKGELGFNYKMDNFLFSSMIGIGEFYNLNIGLHYKI